MTVRSWGLGLGLLALVFQISCSDEGALPYTRGDGGVNPGEACADEDGPAVTVLLPAAAADPNADPIVTDPNLTVECAVASTGTQVDTGSVSIRISDAGENSVAPTVVDNGDGTFSGTANLSEFPNGPLAIVCEASDSAPTARCGSGTVDTFLDLGPTLTILSPGDNSLQSGSMSIQWTDSEAPLSETDTMAGVAGNSLVVAGASIPFGPEDVSQGVATIVVDFSDATLYETPLNGDYEFTVSATNQRGVTRRVTRGFTVDAGGPEITIVEPVLASLITGATNVIAEISDPSNIDPTTVRFRINAEEFNMDPVPGTNRFIGSFDANQYPVTIGQITINVTASDLAGNDRTKSVSVQLDSVPPLIDMDPPTVREGAEVEDGIICSEAFDPLGPEAASDAFVLGPNPDFRARIQDDTNRVSAIFGVDTNDVQVYILDDHNQALLIDTDEDGICDSINPEFLPNNAAGNPPAVVIDLTPVAPTGTAWFRPNTPFAFPYTALCFGGDNGNGTGTATTEPDELCLATSLTRVIPDSWDPALARPSVYGRAPLGEFRCLGDRTDFTGAGLDPGFACVAARATDNGGNESVSSPLRVCLDDFLGPPDCPTGIGGTFAPDFSCTSGCLVDPLDFPSGERIGPR